LLFVGRELSAVDILPRLKSGNPDRRLDIRVRGSRPAIEELVQAGLTPDYLRRSLNDDDDTLTPAQLEARQQTVAHRQRQIIRFQRLAVFGGLGWAVLTFASGSTGPAWTAIGMVIIVLMASSTYRWQYIPGFQ